jgi:hypothetical protein
MANVALGVILTQLIANGAGSTILLDPAPPALALISAGLILVPAVVVRRNAPSRKRTRQQTLGLILLLCGIALCAAAVYAQMAQGLPLWELPRHLRALPALAVLATGLGLTIIEGLRLRFARRRRQAGDRTEPETRQPTPALADHKAVGMARHSIAAIRHDPKTAHSQIPVRQ